MPGPEIGVASTKAFTCQLAALACLAIAAGRARGVLAEDDERKLVRALIEVPRHMAEALRARAADRAARRANSRRAATCSISAAAPRYPLALEGALKLKEISYIHAEGYAAGELKHGPIALIDENMPVIVIAPYERCSRRPCRTCRRWRRAAAGSCWSRTRRGAREATVESLVTLTLPEMPSTVAPLVYAIPVQLLAYHTAVVMGTDVDQPRNLAKSVTVE